MGCPENGRYMTTAKRAEARELPTQRDKSVGSSWIPTACARGGLSVCQPALSCGMGTEAFKRGKPRCGKRSGCCQSAPQLRLHCGGNPRRSRGRAGCQALPSSSNALAPGLRTRRAVVKANSWRSPRNKWEDNGEQRPSSPPEQEVSSQRIFLKLKLSEPDN